MTPVTVLMSTYNRCRYLPEALDSILAQTVPPAQVIVVDDGSTDQTSAVLDRYGDRIERLHQENRGKAAALNRALKLVRGDYVWVFDDDDIARPNALESNLRHIGDDVDFVYSGYDRARTRADGALEIVGQMPSPDVPSNQLFITLLDRCVILQQAMLARSSCYEEVGAYDERLVRSQDYDMILRLAYRFRGARNPENTFALRLHESERGNARHNVAFARRKDAWADFDKIIAAYWYKRLALAEYLGRSPGEATRTTADRRAALIVRASILARKGFWYEAVDDLTAAVDTDRSPLSVPERAALARMMRMHYWASYKPLVHDRWVARQLRQLLGGDAFGRSVRAELIEGLRDELREAKSGGDLKVCAALVDLCARLLGLSGLVNLALRR